MNDLLDQARMNVAARYPVAVGKCSHSGMPIYNQPRRAIMAGKWDAGKLVQDELARLALMALPENEEEG